MKFYTGVGSRQTPPDIRDLMTAVASYLGAAGWTLRSGGADGADQAFELGTMEFGAELPENEGRMLYPREIYIPWPGFSGMTRHDPGVIDLGHLALSDHAAQLARLVHPAWHLCSAAACKLHTRNVFQVLGKDLATPSKFLICWTPKGELVGGTATAIRLAQRASIPVFNLGLDPDRARLEDFVR